MVNGSIRTPSAPAAAAGEVGGGGQVAGDGGRGGDLRRHQVRPPALALPALEVAVGRRRAALPRRQLVGVHAQAHRAAGVRHSAPAAVKTLSRPSASACQPRPAPSRGRPASVRRRATCRPSRTVGGGAQVLDPAVGARAEEDGVDRDVAQRRPGASGPCTPARARRPPGRARRRIDAGSGTAAASGSALAGVGAPGDERRERRSASMTTSWSNVASSSVRRVRQYADRGVPVGALRARADGPCR